MIRLPTRLYYLGQEGVSRSKLQIDLDLGRWLCMVLDWTPEEASLEALQDQPFSAAASVCI